MSQIWNLPAPATANLSEQREAVNDGLESLRSNHAGEEEPENPVRGQLWHDDTAKMLKVRNWANTAWINVVATE